MKGILIIGFNRSPGAYIETQYPHNISEAVKLQPTDLMNIYALHRMRKMEPNFHQIKMKNVRIASFYTGFSFKHYIGRPDYAITIILSDDDELSKDFEGKMRKYAHEVLPTIDQTDFDYNFKKNFQLLKKGELEPYWDEIKEGQGSEIATTSTVDSEGLSERQISDIIDNVAIHLDDLNFINQFKEIELRDLRLEINELREHLNEQNDLLNNFAGEIVKHTTDKEKLEKEVQNLKKQIEVKDLQLDGWSYDLADVNEKTVELLRENTELRDTITKLENKILSLQKSIKPVKIVSKAPKKKAVSTPSASEHDEIREKWLKTEAPANLEPEISKINMNVIRNIVKPWNLKPKGRSKKDLINAVINYIQEKRK